jgi:hypothetical protein
MDPIYEHVTGRYGTADPLDIPDTPDGAETVAHWLVTSVKGAYHPLFDQWILAGVRLRDNIPGFPPPHRQFEGATHEILCVTLNPEAGRYDPERIKQHYSKGKGGLPFLEPPNVVVQVEAQDQEVRQVISLLAQSVIHGAMNPESLWTAGLDKQLNLQWTSAIVKTLAHGRGETHAP